MTSSTAVEVSSTQKSAIHFFPMLPSHVPLHWLPEALIANGVEAGTIQCGRPKEQKFWISIAYRDSFFLLNSDATCFLCRSRALHFNSSMHC